MPSDDREKQFERALARHLRSASPDASCPDAEILAAYHQRILSLDEMAHWKGHIAACSRCQETLALVEQTESIPTGEWEKQRVAAASLSRAAVRQNEENFEEMPAQLAAAPATVPAAAKTAGAPTSPQRRAPWRLFLPAGVLAAGLLLWVAVHEKSRAPEQTAGGIQVAENRQPGVPPPPPPAETRELRKQGELVSPKPQASPRPSEETAAKAKKAAPAETLPVPAAGAMQRNRPAKTERDEQQSMDAITAARSAPPAPPQESSQPAQGLVTARAPAPAALPSAEVTGGAAAPSRSANELKSAQQQKPEVAGDPGATQQVEVTSAYAARSMRKDSSLDRNVIFAPDRLHAWRFGLGGKIERTTDSGKSWVSQTSGVTSDLTAGSAPSDNVCWIVGKAGTLLLTTDAGKHWKQIPSPIADDLGGVHAVDAQHASIWDLPNRQSYETSDGGATWHQVANE